MIVHHFTNEQHRLRTMLNVFQDNQPDFKPKGLWVSDETDYGWSQWCEAEDFHTDRFGLTYEIELRDERLLWLRTEDELDQFTRKYSAGPIGGRPVDIHLDQRIIRWDAVAAEYMGIMITPYQWSRRLNLMWYYGWDCASGCIWDLRAVRSFRQVTALDALSSQR